MKIQVGDLIRVIDCPDEGGIVIHVCEAPPGTTIDILTHYGYIMVDKRPPQLATIDEEGELL